jgi:hypothetical protein
MLISAHGGSIKMDAYRIAYEEAASELRDISVKFNELAARKERIEELIAAFRALIEVELHAVAS